MRHSPLPCKGRLQARAPNPVDPLGEYAQKYSLQCVLSVSRISGDAEGGAINGCVMPFIQSGKFR